MGPGRFVYTTQSLVRTTLGWESDEPGFISSLQPLGDPPAFALPGDLALGFNVLPMSIDGSVSSLFFWDGLSGSASDDVRLVPAQGMDLVVERGSDSLVVGQQTAKTPGFTIGVTSPTGTLHEHLDFVIDAGTFDSPEGFYVIALELTTDRLEKSDPIFLALGPQNPNPFELPPSPFFEFADFWDPRESAVEQWLAEQRPVLLSLNSCVNFDGDNDVDSEDLLQFIAAWTGDLGRDPGSVPIGSLLGDCNADGDVDAQDLSDLLAEWTGFQEAGAIVVPEPSTGLLGMLIVGLAWTRGSRRRRPQKMPS